MQSDFYGRRPWADHDSLLRPGVGSWNVMFRQLVCVGVALVGLVACNKTDPEPLTSGAGTTSSPAATTSTTSSTSTSTTTSTTATNTPPSTEPIATTVPAAPGAPPVPTDGQWLEILGALEVRLTAMYADPANADITSVCVAGSECELQYATQMEDMVKKGWHTENESPSEVVSIDKVVDVAATSNGAIPPGTEYEITFTRRLGDLSNAVVADTDGKVVYRLVPDEATPEVSPATGLLMWYPDDQELPWRWLG